MVHAGLEPEEHAKIFANCEATMSGKPEQLFQVTASYFCCGLVVRDDKVIEAAPIMRWAVNRTLVSIREWVQAKNGSIAEVKRMEA